MRKLLNSIGFSQFFQCNLAKFSGNAYKHGVYRTHAVNAKAG